MGKRERELERERVSRSCWLACCYYLTGRQMGGVVAEPGHSSARGDRRRAGADSSPTVPTRQRGCSIIFLLVF